MSDMTSGDWDTGYETARHDASKAVREALEGLPILDMQVRDLLDTATRAAVRRGDFDEGYAAGRHDAGQDVIALILSAKGTPDTWRHLIIEAARGSLIP